MAGTYLLAAPTAVTIFGNNVGLARPLLMKWAIFMTWLVVAALVVRLGFTRDDQIERLTDAALNNRNNLRRQAISYTFDGMLGEKRTFPSTWDFTVYLYSETTKRLEPSWPQQHRSKGDIAVFEPGKGAVGEAWLTKESVFAFDEEVSDSTYELTEKQQEHFKGRLAVAATPIYSDTDEIMGVLAAISNKSDRRFSGGDGQAKFETIAAVVGTLVVRLETTD